MNDRLMNFRNRIVDLLTMKQLAKWHDLKGTDTPIREQFVLLSKITRSKKCLRWSAIAIDMIDKRGAVNDG